MAKVEDCPGFETFGADVKAARKAKHLTRKVLAEIVGIEWRYLANIENKGTIPSLPVVIQLIKVCGLPVEQYFNPEIKQAYVAIEDFAKGRLQRMLPQELQPSFQPLLFPQSAEQDLWRIVKAADKICAYLKCVEELKAGNQEFAKAERTIRQELDQVELSEVGYFMEHFAPSFGLALDELN